MRLAGERDDPARAGMLDQHLGAEMAQHVFAVVAGRLGFLDPGDPGSIQPAQQERGLDLGRRHRHPVFERQGFPRALDRQRQPAALARGEPGTTGRQRIRHPAHRAAAQACVAGHHTKERMARQDAGQQPRRRARVAHVQHIGGLHQATHAPPRHAPGARTILCHLPAERPHRGGRAQHVLAFEQAADPRLANRQGAEHKGAVADRLVAGNGDGAPEGGRGAGGAEGLERVHHGRALSTSALS